MSYKIDLSEVTRDGAVSLTQQLVDRFVAAIEAGELDPGEKLPPTRELAELVGVNHLTAARVYRRLAELGYVTASVGRGTFVRALAPARSEEHGDEWQAYALPEHELSYPERVLAEVMSSTGQPDMISLAVGWPSPRLYPTDELARITADVFAEEGGEALSYLPARGPLRIPRAARGAGARARLRRGPGRDHRDLGGEAGDQPRRARDARARRRGRDRVPQLRGHARLAATDRRARDRRARGPGWLRRGHARAAARPPRGEAGGAPDRVPEPHGSRPLRGAPRAAGGSGAGTQLLRARGPRLRGCELRRQAGPAAARAGARARDLRELAVEAGGRRPAGRLGRGERPCARADRDAQARG